MRDANIHRMAHAVLQGLELLRAAFALIGAHGSLESGKRAARKLSTCFT